MPSSYKIPARTERHCEPCEHLKRENMLCSRLHGISSDYVCHHPDVKWRMIGRNDKQPDWCPLKGEPANDGTQRPGTPDVSLATETRKPGSLK